MVIGVVEGMSWAKIGLGITEKKRVMMALRWGSSGSVRRSIVGKIVID